MKRNIGIAALVAVLFSLLSGFPALPAWAAAKESMVMSIHAEPTTMDPAEAKDIVSQMIQFQLFDTLVKKASDNPNEVIPCIAESWTTPSPTEIVFKIRGDVKFHNGESMTMDDVLFSLGRALKSTFTSGYNGPVAGFERIDDGELKMMLKYPYAPVMDIIANVSFAIVSKNAFESAVAKGVDFGRAPVGTGPYRFVEWKSGDRIVVKANEDYFGQKAAIRDITFRIMTDQGTAAFAVRNGEIDVLNMAQNSDWPILDADKKLYFMDCGSDGCHFIVFNCESGIFSNKLLRQAVSYAINREDIILGGNDGDGEPNECLTPTMAFGYLADFRNNPYDPVKAKELLKQAGYPDGFTVRLRVNQANTYVKPAEVIQDELRRIGIVLDFDKMERGAYLADVVGASRFEIAVHMVNATVGDADNVLTRKLHSSMTGNGNNYGKYANPEVDRLIDAARVESDPEKRLALYRRVYEIMREDAPIIPLFSSTNRTYLNGGLKGAHPQVAFQFRLNEWYWEK